MKVLERDIEKRLRDKVQIDNMQFGFGIRGDRLTCASTD